MKFGVFDYIEGSDQPLHKTYEERLELGEQPSTDVAPQLPEEQYAAEDVAGAVPPIETGNTRR